MHFRLEKVKNWVFLLYIKEKIREINVSKTIIYEILSNRVSQKKFHQIDETFLNDTEIS